MNELLVTVEDVKNALGIDIGADLGLNPKQTNRWLQRTQRHILTYIALHAYHGERQVQEYLQDDGLVKVIKEVILEQIEFIKANNYVEADKVLQVNGGSTEPAIAPYARDLLLASGLLYTGRI